MRRASGYSLSGTAMTAAPIVFLLNGGGVPARGRGGVFVKLAHNLVDDFARMRNDGDHDWTFVSLRLFERGELAIEQ
jgi:hypothetical protein